MSAIKVVATRWVVCSHCGNRERLLSVSRREFVSTCLMCGDVASGSLTVQLRLPIEQEMSGSRVGPLVGSARP